MRGLRSDGGIGRHAGLYLNFPVYLIFIYMNIKYTKERLTEVVSECESFRQVLKKLGLKEAGGNYANIQKRIKQFDIDTSHFHGQVWNKGKTWSKVKDITDVLVENSTYKTGLHRSTYQLKKQLFRLGYKEKICEVCNNTEWMGHEIPLELHHINGNKYDNRIENLQILCPNCHSFTDNYRGKNMSAREETL